MILLVLMLSAYLLGAVPFGYIVGKMRNIDITKHGSGSTGATNISRTLGVKYAVLVGAGDFLKGAIPAFIAAQLTNNEFAISLIALAAIIGHIFSIFLKFNGGKGVATYSGALLVLLGPILFTPTAILWLGFLYISKIMSLTNLIITLIIPIVFLVFDGSTTYFFFSLTALLLIWYSHRDNIKRLAEGSERKLF